MTLLCSLMAVQRFGFRSRPHAAREVAGLAARLSPYIYHWSFQPPRRIHRFSPSRDLLALIIQPVCLGDTSDLLPLNQIEGEH
jgi:hypothetical protein